MIDRHFGSDVETGERIPDPLLTGLHDALKLARTAAERAQRLTTAVLRNEMKTVATRHKQAKEESWRVTEPATKAIDKARADTLAAASAIRSEIAVPRRRADASTTILDGEIRRHLQTLSPEARSAAIRNAIESGDDSIVAAVLAGPPMLSGLADRGEAEEYRLSWQLARFPAEVARLERLEKAVYDTEQAGSLLLGFYAQLVDSNVLAKAEKSERAAADAIRSE